MHRLFSNYKRRAGRSVQMERWGGLHLRGFVRVMPDDKGTIRIQDRVGRSSWAGRSAVVAVSRLNNESSPRGPLYTRSCGAVDITRAKVEGGGHHLGGMVKKKNPSARTAPPRLSRASRSRRRLLAANRPRLRGAPPRATRQVPEPAPHGSKTTAAAAAAAV